LPFPSAEAKGLSADERVLAFEKDDAGVCGERPDLIGQHQSDIAQGGIVR